MTGKKKEIPCPHCPQTCSTPWNLKVHIRRAHQRKGEPVKSGLYSTSIQFASDIGNTPTVDSYDQIPPNNGHFSGLDSKNLEQQQPSKKRDAGRELLETMREMVEIKNMWNQLQPPASSLGQLPGTLGSMMLLLCGLNARFDPINYNCALQFYNILMSDRNIGFRGHICEKCYTWRVDLLNSNAEGLKSLIRSTKPSPHTCDSQAHAQNVEDIESKINGSENELITNLLFLIIICWSCFGQRKIFLKTEELTSPAPSSPVFHLLQCQIDNQIQIEDEDYNAIGQKLQALRQLPRTFWLDGEEVNCNSINVDLTKVEVNHWAYRGIEDVLRDGRSSKEIDTIELMNFVRTVKATFGICATDIGESIRKFLFYLYVD